MMKKTWSETNNFEKTADFYFRWNCMFSFKSVWFKSLNASRTFGDHPLRWRQFFIFGTFISEPHKTNLFVTIFEQIWRKTVNAEMIFKIRNRWILNSSKTFQTQLDLNSIRRVSLWWTAAYFSTEFYWEHWLVIITLLIVGFSLALSIKF